MAFFQDFPVLENAKTKFQGFPVISKPVRTLLQGDKFEVVCYQPPFSQDRKKRPKTHGVTEKNLSLKWLLPLLCTDQRSHTEPITSPTLPCTTSDKGFCRVIEALLEILQGIGKHFIVILLCNIVNGATLPCRCNFVIVDNRGQHIT